MPEDGALAIKPATMSYKDAASIPNRALTALPFLRDKGRIQSGQSVLIYGASGSVGSAAVQLTKYDGTEVTRVCSTENLEWVKSLGADRVIDYTQGDFTENGKTYDIIFDTIDRLSFSECKGSLAERGVFLTTGIMPGNMLQVLRTSITGGKKAMFAATGLRPAKEKTKDLIFLTRTSRNQKGKAAQKGVTPQGGEKGEKQEAFPTAAFPDRNCSTVKGIWHLEL